VGYLKRWPHCRAKKGLGIFNLLPQGGNVKVVLLVDLHDGALGRETQSVKHIAGNGREVARLDLKGKCFRELVKRLVRDVEHLLPNGQNGVMKGDTLFISQHRLKRVAMNDAGEPRLRDTKLLSNISQGDLRVAHQVIHDGLVLDANALNLTQRISPNTSAPASTVH
jgi:hypothetical protein